MAMHASRASPTYLHRRRRASPVVDQAASLQKPLGRDDSNRLRQRPNAKVAGFGRLLGIAAVNEKGPAPGASTCLHVAPAVSDHEARLQVNSQLQRRSQQHYGGRLSAVADIGIVMEAAEHR